MKNEDLLTSVPVTADDETASCHADSLHTDSLHADFAAPEDRRCYTVADLQRILGISRGSVYELLKRQEFKWFKVGGCRYRISKKSFDHWLDGAI